MNPNNAVPLKDLLTHIHDRDLITPAISEINPLILGLSSDSRHAQAGDLFFAFKGEQHHGLHFINQLIDKKVSAILYTPDTDIVLPITTIPLIAINNLQTYLQTIAHFFYDAILKSLKIIGITGTEGKTSVAQFIAQSIELNHQPCGYIGTNGIGRLPPFSQTELLENTHTTPDFLSLLKALNTLKNTLNATPETPKYVVLEVTSHALAQNRIHGLRFEAVVFTNLNRDHLDYHHTLEEYGAAKAKLFTDYPANVAILNTDDNFVNQRLIPLIQKTKNIDVLDNHAIRYMTFGTDENANFQISQISLLPEGLTFNLQTHACSKNAPNAENRIEASRASDIHTKLYGHFMASNLAATAATLSHLNFSFDQICQTLSQLTTVTGRMQKVVWTQSLCPPLKTPIVIVDYAHKPNALLQALSALKQHIHTGKLICVFGCGGDRDRGKRPIMGKIATENADFSIITSDNPRTESAEAIIEDILAGISSQDRTRVYVENDRKKAIHHALKIATPFDIILIAGKGHETYQIIGQTKSHFDDREVVINYWEKL